MDVISKAWCLSLQDCVFLTSQASSLQSASQGQNLIMAGTFFSAPSGAKFDRQRDYFAVYWPKIVRAASANLVNDFCKKIRSLEDIPVAKTPMGNVQESYQIMFVSCLDALCGDLSFLLRSASNCGSIGKAGLGTASVQIASKIRHREDLIDIFHALLNLLRGSISDQTSDFDPVAILSTDLLVFKHSSRLSFELLAILKRVALAQDSAQIHLLIVQICICLCTKWKQENLAYCDRNRVINGETETQLNGTRNGPQQEHDRLRCALAIAILEINVSILTKYYPAILHTLAPSVSSLEQAPGTQTRLRYPNPVLSPIYTLMTNCVHLLKTSKESPIHSDVVNHHRVLLRLVIQTAFAELVKPGKEIEVKRENHVWSGRLTTECRLSCLSADSQMAFMNSLDLDDEVDANQTWLLFLLLGPEAAKIGKDFVKVMCATASVAQGDLQGTLASALNLLLCQHNCDLSEWSPDRLCCLTSLWLVSSVVARAPEMLWMRSVCNSQDDSLGPVILKCITNTVPQGDELLCEMSLVFHWIDALARDLVQRKSGNLAESPQLHSRLVIQTVQDALELAESLLTHCDAESRASLMLLVVAAHARLLSLGLGLSVNGSLFTIDNRRGYFVSWHALEDAVHMVAVSRLLKVILKFPLEFKSISGSLGEQKDLLERAIRAATTSSNTAPHNETGTAAPKSEHSIKLKMDFGNFA
ncbi:hypothetical protein Ciccas_000287 [Cichlidogyrus casuarinus]|uniref:Uncharacterized protein n=1 Tax=Cichlidogyrus casuarinus TaxID=1844966 RepID=A0ABD2QNF0_9PLAT